MHSAKAVGNWWIERFRQERKTIDQLQLQKLVYISHGWHLALSSEKQPLVLEPILAWKYGPVVNTLRDEFKDFGASPITRLATEFSWDGDLVEPVLSAADTRPWERELLEWTFDRYGDLSGPQLIELTHRSGTPWATVTEGGRRIDWSTEIPNGLIQRHYEGLLDEMRRESAR